jgi:hypothetical protein
MHPSAHVDGRAAVLLTQEHLGRDVPDRAIHLLRVRQRRGRGPGEAEVADLEPAAVLPYEHVPGLQVAVLDAVGVHRPRAGKQLRHRVTRLRLGERDPVAAARGDDVVEAWADVLQDEVGSIPEPRTTSRSRTTAAFPRHAASSGASRSSAAPTTPAPLRLDLMATTSPVRRCRALETAPNAPRRSS